MREVQRSGADGGELNLAWSSGDGEQAQSSNHSMVRSPKGWVLSDRESRMHTVRYG